MTGTQTTEVRRNTGKDILIYIALVAVTVLSAVVYLWLSFSPPKTDTEKAQPWALTITSVLGMDESDLQEICALDSVERIERGSDVVSTELIVWIPEALPDRESYEKALALAEADLSTLAARKEAARVEELRKAHLAEAEAEKAGIESKLEELAKLQEKLDAQAQKLSVVRQKLDEKNADLQERENVLSSVRTALNSEGRALGEEEVQLNAPDGSLRAETARHYREQREAWYAGGEDYLDVHTLYERDRQALDREERRYAADLAAYEAEQKRLDDARAALEEDIAHIPELPEIEDCTWRLRRNPDGWTDPAADKEESTFSPLKLAIQMLFLGVAALSGWLFCAKLLSDTAGTISKPRSMTENASEEAHAGNVMDEEKSESS